MKQQIKKSILIFLFIILLNISSAYSENKLDKKILEIKQNINNDTVNLNKYNNKIKSLNKEIINQNNKISDINYSINKIISQQKELNIELDKLEHNLKNNQEVIKKYLIVMHKHNNYPKLKLLLSKDIFNWSLILNYLKFLNNHEKAKFDIVIKQIEKITALYNKISHNKLKLSNDQKKLELAKNQLIELQEKEAILRDNAKKNIESNKSKLAELLKVISSKNINRVKSPSNFKELKAKLIMPIEGKVLKFNDDSTEEKLTQNGVFIKEFKNHKFIHSIYDGKVVFADWLKLYGNVVIVDHMNGYMSLYANNDKIITKVGSYIQAGEQIAVIGNSGEFGQQGSYFELRYQGKPLNPIRWLKIG